MRSESEKNNSVQQDLSWNGLSRQFLDWVDSFWIVWTVSRLSGQFLLSVLTLIQQQFTFIFVFRHFWKFGQFLDCSDSFWRKGDVLRLWHTEGYPCEISTVQCSALSRLFNIKWWISIMWWSPIIWRNAIIWWIPTWGASTSLIHDMMESHHMMELHHMMTFHHMKTFYLGYDGLQSF